MKKPKTLETKLYKALRLIWRGSPERRAVKAAATFKDAELGKAFICPICSRKFHEKMEEVDHIPPIGGIQNWRDVESVMDKMFFGPQRVICCLCHKKVTAAQRRAK